MLYVLALLVVLSVPTLGAALMFISGRVGDKLIRAQPAVAPTLFYVLACGSIAVAIAFTALVGLSLNRLDRDDIDTRLAAMIVGTIVVGLALWSVTVFMGIARGVSSDIPDERVAALRRRQTSLQVIGSILMLVLFLGIFRGFLVLIVPVVLVVSAVVIACIHRRIQQGNTLSMLAISVDRGLPLTEEVQAMATGVRGARRRRLKSLAAQLAEGVPLSEALAGTGSLVPAGTVMATAAGEQSGTLGLALRENAAQDAESLQRIYLGTPFVWLVVYFSLILMIVQAVIAYQMYYIVPKFKKIFEDFGTELPDVTRGMIQASDTFVRYFYLLGPAYWLPLAPLVILGMILFRRWNFSRVPWVSRLLPREDTPALLRSLAFIVEAKQPLPDALNRLAKVAGDRTSQNRLRDVQKDVKSGGNCWDALAKHSLLNRPEVELLNAAEKVGNLPFVLRELAANIERRRDYRMYLALEIVRPVVVFSLGIVVGVYCLAFFTPIVKLILDFS